MKALTVQDSTQVIQEERLEQSLTRSKSKRKKKKSYLGIYRIFLSVVLLFLIATAIKILFILDTVSYNLNSINSQLSIISGKIDKSVPSYEEDFFEIKSSISEINNILNNKAIVYEGKSYLLPEPYYSQDGEIIDPSSNIHYYVVSIEDSVPVLQPTKQSIYLYLSKVAEYQDHKNDSEYVDKLYTKLITYYSNNSVYPEFSSILSKTDSDAFISIIGLSEE